MLVFHCFSMFIECQCPEVAYQCNPSHNLSVSQCFYLPSGELTFCHGKSQFFMGKSTISMAIFHCFLYVHQRVIHLMLWTPATRLRQCRSPGMKEGWRYTRTCSKVARWVSKLQEAVGWTGRCWRFGVKDGKGAKGGSIVKGQNAWLKKWFIKVYNGQTHENPWPLGWLTIVETSSHRAIAFLRLCAWREQQEGAQLQSVASADLLWPAVKSRNSA